jgi:2-isopropylmalate synthase
VGTGVNSISTGTPFVAPRIFQPFDAEGVLGVAPTVVLTHLASARVVQAVAAARGLHLEPAEVAEVQARAKARAYETGKAEVDLDEVLGPGEGR